MPRSRIYAVGGAGGAVPQRGEVPAAVVGAKDPLHEGPGQARVALADEPEGVLEATDDAHREAHGPRVPFPPEHHRLLHLGEETRVGGEVGDDRHEFNRRDVDVDRAGGCGHVFRRS